MKDFDLSKVLLFEEETKEGNKKAFLERMKEFEEILQEEKEVKHEGTRK